MTYDEIARLLFDRSICPVEAKCAALNEFRNDSSIATIRWADCWPEMVEAAQELLADATAVVNTNYYHPCVRAGFFAAFFSSTEQQLVGSMENTRRADDCFDCRLGKCNCPRQATGISGDRYDNCLSVHAAQWLEIPYDHYANRLLWMEAGAVFNGERYELANGPSNNPFDRVYRCSMCLKTMLGKGVVDLCNVGLDKHGNVSLTIAPIAATLNTLVIVNYPRMNAGACH